MMHAAPRSSTFERAIPIPAEFEFRGAPNDGGLPRFYGYAAVFDADSEPLPYTETVNPAAFTRTLAQHRNHSFVIDHDDSKLLATRRTERLVLAPDSKGLLTDSALPKTQYARDLVALYEEGEIRSMSFTFRPMKQADGSPGDRMSSDGKRRTLLNVSLGHVTVLTGHLPAYRQTTAAMRSLAGRLGVENEELDAVIESLREGTPLTVRAIDLLQSVIAELREQPADEPAPEVPVLGIPFSVAQRRLALAAKAR